MSVYRQLFPPLIPASIPAYDGTSLLKFYFKPSVANDRSQLKHVQIIINRLDTNTNALNTVNYPLGIIFIKNEQIFLDSAKAMYYFQLPANLLPIDTYYKLQMRVGTQDLNTVNKIDYVWLNTPSVVQEFSEWSNVCIIKPVTRPDFGFVGFEVDVEPYYAAQNSINVANTPGFTFIGYYRAADFKKEEILKTYRVKLYDYTTGALLSDSGDKYSGDLAQQAIQHTFNVMMDRGKYYNVELSIVSKNGYYDTKLYKILCMFVDSHVPNVLKAFPNSDLAKIKLTVQAKRLLFETVGDSTVTYIRDSNEAPPEILKTHAIIDGTIIENKNLEFYATQGEWVVQFRAMGITPQNSKEEAYQNWIFSLEESPGMVSPYYIKIKVGAYKKKISSSFQSIERWDNDFVMRKELWVKNNEAHSLILTQEKRVSFAGPNRTMSGQQFINPLSEYYFFIKESNGVVTFDVKHVRDTTIQL